jgi:hypothetical protein
MAVAHLAAHCLMAAKSDIVSCFHPISVSIAETLPYTASQAIAFSSQSHSS